MYEQKYILSSKLYCLANTKAEAINNGLSSLSSKFKFSLCGIIN